jgi:protein phosphatase
MSPVPLAVGARSETGYVREENQDRMSCVRTSLYDVYIVSDGMGGHKGGATAAELTVEMLGQNLSTIDSREAVNWAIQYAFKEANKIVYERGHTGDAEIRGMGATAVVLLLGQSEAAVAHVGDSRAYLYRSGELRRLTKDHSHVQRMVDAGILSAEEAAVHPTSHLLERAIGVSPDVVVDLSSWFELNRGDRILLSSDGLHGYVTDNEICSLMEKTSVPQDIVDQLVNLALQKGGEDNITVQLIQYGNLDYKSSSRQ